MLICNMKKNEVFHFPVHPHVNNDPAIFKIVGKSENDPSKVTCRYFGTPNRKILGGHFVDFDADEDVVNMTAYENYLKSDLL